VVIVTRFRTPRYLQGEAFSVAALRLWGLDGEGAREFTPPGYFLLPRCGFGAGGEPVGAGRAANDVDGRCVRCYDPAHER
jgi:hypothetical protein